MLFASAQPEPPKNLDMISRATATYFDIPKDSKPTSRPRRSEQRMEREASRAPNQMLCVKFGRRPIKDTLPKPGKNSKNKDLATMYMILALRPRLVISLRLPKKRKNCFHVMWLVEKKKKKETGFKGSGPRLRPCRPGTECFASWVR